MKKVSRVKARAFTGNTMRREYDFRKGARGRYAKRFAEGVKLVSLDPDVARVFGDSREVNSALRALSKLAKRAAS